MDPSNDSGRLRRATTLLLGLSVAMSALAVFQWFELWQVRHGGTAVCSLNAAVNCETVWNSALAERVHALLGVPVAALGLIWGATALLQSARLWAGLRRGKPTLGLIPALRVIALVGLVATLLFAAGSYQAHALCLTCLGSYLLAIAFAGVAFAMIPEPLFFLGSDGGRSVWWTGGVALAGYLLLLWPGHATPGATATIALPTAPGAAGTADAQSDAAALRAYLATISPEEKAALARSLAEYRAAAPPMEALAFPPRTPMGNPHAPVHVTDFTDIKCPHCKHLEALLAQLFATLPPGRLAVESRYYPLDPECNPRVEPGPRNSLRCLGAKAQLCLEKAPDLAALQQALFAEQESLTTERVLEIASSGSVSRAQLEACIASPETAARLTQDIQLARAYGIQGTPLLVVNGRSAGSPPPSFLYVLALAGGDANAPALAALSTP